MHRVLVARASYRDCRGAVEQALAAFPLPIRGRKVLVKVNSMNGAEPEEAIVTHPAVLRAVLESLDKMGAGEVAVGDNPGVNCYGKNEPTLRANCLGEVAGEHYVNLGREARAVPFYPEFVDQVFVSRAILDADVVISLPKFKTHIRVGVSCALKNNFGTLPGAQKANMHRRASTAVGLARALVEVYRLRPPDLVITDAILVMEGDGPYSRELRYLGLVLASDNGVAMDATVARMMGYDPAQLPLLRFAQEAGLGSYREDDIQVLGPWDPIPSFRRQALEEVNSLVPIASTGLIAEVPEFRPAVDAGKCDGCRICAVACPPGALTMANGLPQLEPALCVPCYCCQESCPQEAIVMGQPV